MSTRSNIIIEDQYKRLQLYRHCDGYPNGQYGVLATLADALKFAWPLPRFDAADFAAAIVRAWKDCGGGNIYIDGSATAWEKIHGDAEWVYLIKAGENEPTVEVYDWHKYWLDSENPERVKPKPYLSCKLSEAKSNGLALKIR